jgi:hypothetical protein
MAKYRNTNQPKNKLTSYGEKCTTWTSEPLTDTFTLSLEQAHADAVQRQQKAQAELTRILLELRKTN